MRAELFTMGIIAALLSLGLGASAQQPTFGGQVLNTTSTPVSVTLMPRKTGTVAGVQVLTQGAPAGEFSDGGGGCSGMSFSNLNTGCTESVTFTPKYPGLRTGAVVLLDSNKAVLAVAYLSGTGQGPLGVFVPGNFIPVVGSGNHDLLEDGQPALDADLNQPATVALDGSGNMYIADSIHNRIRKVDAKTNLISTIAGNGSAGFAGDNGPATSAELNIPNGVAVDGAGNIYIADTGNNRVREIYANTGIIVTVAGNGTISSVGGGTYSGDGGPASAAGLNGPWGVTVDLAGNLYIADTGNHRVRRIDANTGVITLVAGNGTADPVTGAGTWSGDGGAAVDASLNRPLAVAFDAAGNMYIPDKLNNRVRVVSTSGTITTFAGTGDPGYSGDGGAAVSAELWSPSGVIVDAAQNVYISDSQNNAIRKVNTSGTIATIVINTVGKYWDGAALQPIALYGPIGLALDGNGNLYVADYYYMRIRELQSNVAVLDFTGTPVRKTELSKTPLPQVLENDGNLPLPLTQIAPVSNSAVSDITPSCAGGSQLAQDASCIVWAEFAPSAVGNPLLGTIDITGTAVDSQFVIDVVGNATPIYAVTVTLTSSSDLSSSTPSSNYGAPVTFTATVTTGAGTGALNGTVTFSDGSKIPPCSGVTLVVNAAATATCTPTTTQMAVGQHTITAVYSGDTNGHTNNDPSNTITQTVYEVTKTILTSSGSPSTVNSPVTLTATVTPGSGGVPLSTGDLVTFTDVTTSTQLGAVPINASGVATIAPTSLNNGVHSISASYSGEPNNYVLGSTATVSQDVQVSSNVTVASSLPTSNYGTLVTFTATVTTSTGTFAPTGTVNFLDGGKQIYSTNLIGTSGVGTFTISSLAVGSHTITVSYLGNPDDAAAVSAPITQTVNLTPTGTVVTATPNPGIAGKPVSLTATVSILPGSAPITGTVTFTDGTTKLGTAQIGANVGLNASASISPTLSAGTHSIVANYSGDANDNSSVGSLSLPVVQATTAVALKTSGSPAMVLSPITFTAVVTSNGGIPTGNVTFTVDNASPVAQPLDSTGTATFSDSALTVGSHTITATYGGDTNDTTVSNSLTQVIQAIPTGTSLASATAGTPPQVVLVATVVGTTGPVPTGTVTFNSGTTVVGQATLDSNGVGTMVPDLASGTYSITATYNPDPDHSTSTSKSVSISTTPQGFNLSVTPATVSVATTANTTITINLDSINGFSDTIGLGCGSLPAAVNCHFLTNDVALKAGSTASVQLTIDTNNPLGGGQSSMNQARGARTMSLASFMWPLAILFGCIFWRFRRRHAIVLFAVLGLVLSGLVGMTGCGGFSQSSAAPGTYTIQINAAGASSNVSHYQNITLTITK
jgi:sugar lactone lactonase YvrE